ncbi:MAG: type II toxin-antitoxin system VapC family toxin [Nanoarchaeota archaeon]
MYLDANLFVFANMDAGEIGDRARSILKDIKRGKRAVTSVLTIDEIMWVLIKNNRRSELKSVVEDIYSIPNLDVKPVSSLIPLRAIDFIEQNGLRPRDAIHAAIMEELGIGEIVSDDADFDRIPSIKRIPI